VRTEQWSGWVGGVGWFKKNKKLRYKMNALFASPTDSINNFENFNYKKQTKNINELVKIYSN
jgi:hypothetical protein